MIKYQVCAGNDPYDYDCESEWIFSETRPTKREAAIELRRKEEDIIQITELK